jgi:DNA-binding MarR family transcriptional regulator
MPSRSRGAAEPPQEDQPYLGAIGSLLTLHRYLRRSSKARWESGISGRQHATLRALGDGPLTMGELSRLLFIGDSATSELVAKLEADGLAKRERSKADNRVVHVSVTAKGREVADRTPLAGLPLLRERLRALDPAELRTIATAVGRILEVMEIEDDR